MKKYIILIVLTISSLVFYAQEPQFQTYSADLLIVATKDGDNVQWQNKDIVVTLNYRTGDFKAIINNTDFYNKQTNMKISEDSISISSEFLFVGIMPIRDIVNQKAINQDYDTELQLINYDMDLTEMINFKMNVMRPNQNAGAYRVFTLTGTLYNYELNLPAFEGYDNEVEIRIMFNGFWSGQ